MGLRCLLSHDFGEPELEREREEQGNEVVITVNEVKTCQRCGERRVVSENTEVTSIDQLTETATAEADTTQATVDTEAAADGTEVAADGTEVAADTGVTIDDSPSVTDDAEVLTDSDDAPEDLGEVTTANMTVDDVESAAAEPVESADDGVILTDDTEDNAETDTEATEADAATAGDTESTAADRQPGEWPAYDAGEEPEAADREWPDVDDEDEGFSADEPSEEAPEDMTFGGGFTPEITGAEGAADDEIELSFTRAEEASVEYEPTVDDIQTEFYCPECGLSRLAGNSSMRAGDICPECRRGYIDERPV